MNVLEKILGEIEELKRNQDSKNQDFVTGYISALSTVEGVIAGLDEAKDINVPSNDGWIPVEDGLPEEKMEVLCCFENGTVQSLWQNWKNDGLGDYFDDDLIPTEVIAWQPLPEPYKGGDDRA
jgi:hypothetical protein|nr:MAG TPA: Protein of unknown function (DUF551) [Caudoviricetes sp.]